MISNDLAIFDFNHPYSWFTKIRKAIAEYRAGKTKEHNFIDKLAALGHHDITIFFNYPKVSSVNLHTWYIMSEFDYLGHYISEKKWTTKLDLT